MRAGLTDHASIGGAYGIRTRDLLLDRQPRTPGFSNAPIQVQIGVACRDRTGAPEDHNLVLPVELRERSGVPPFRLAAVATANRNVDVDA